MKYGWKYRLKSIMDYAGPVLLMVVPLLCLLFVFHFWGTLTSYIVLAIMAALSAISLFFR